MFIAQTSTNTDTSGASESWQGEIRENKGTEYTLPKDSTDQKQDTSLKESNNRMQVTSPPPPPKDFDSSMLNIKRKITTLPEQAF